MFTFLQVWSKHDFSEPSHQLPGWLPLIEQGKESGRPREKRGQSLLPGAVPGDWCNVHFTQLKVDTQVL